MTVNRHANAFTALEELEEVLGSLTPQDVAATLLRHFPVADILDGLAKACWQYSQRRSLSWEAREIETVVARLDAWPNHD